LECRLSGSNTAAMSVSLGSTAARRPTYRKGGFG
jgi:hypothetical protein